MSADRVDVLPPEVVKEWGDDPSRECFDDRFGALCDSHEALRAERDELKQSEDMSFGCFHMIAETLTAHGYPCELKSTPPMFLNDAVHNALAAARRERDEFEKIANERGDHLRALMLQVAGAVWAFAAPSREMDSAECIAIVDRARPWR
jgi:hypothetical protein